MFVPRSTPEPMKQIKILFQIVCAARYPKVLQRSIFNWYGVVNRGWLDCNSGQSISFLHTTKSMNVSDLILYFLSHVMEIQNTFVDLKRTRRLEALTWDALVDEWVHTVALVTWTIEIQY